MGGLPYFRFNIPAQRPNMSKRLATAFVEFSSRPTEKEVELAAYLHQRDSFVIHEGGTMHADKCQQVIQKINDMSRGYVAWITYNCPSRALPRPAE